MGPNFKMGISRLSNEMVSLPVLKILAKKGHFGCPLGLSWAFWDPNEIKIPNHFFGSGIAVFIGFKHGFRIASISVSKILNLNKKAILAAHWAQFGHFEI